MNITTKQRNVFWLVIALLVAIYYAPSLIMSARRAAYVRDQALQQQHAQDAAHQQTAKLAADLQSARQKREVASASVTVGGADAPIAEPPITAAALFGIWQGTGTVPEKGRFCQLHLELRESPQEVGHILGYPSLSCLNLAPGNTGVSPFSPALSNLNPTTAILNGMWDKTGALRFTVVKSLAASGSCPLTGFVFTPFGINTATIEYQEGTCQSGNIVLRKSRT